MVAIGPPVIKIGMVYQTLLKKFLFSSFEWGACTKSQSASGNERARAHKMYDFTSAYETVQLVDIMKEEDVEKSFPSSQKSAHNKHYHHGTT